MPLDKGTEDGREELSGTASVSNGNPFQTLQLLTSPVPSLDLAFTKIKSATHSGQYAEALTHTTTVVNELLDMVVKFIDLRLFVAQKTSNNRQELEDALLLTQIDPQNCTSFLRSSKMHSIQGNQEAAREVLQKGIDVCLEQDHHVLLQRQLRVVQAQMNRRVDFVAQFPYEILCNVLWYFDMATTTTSMGVCRHWRHRVLHCPIPWRSIDISAQNPSLGIITKVLPTIAPHVQELHVMFKSNFMDAWTGFFRLYNFSGLRSLRLDTECEYSYTSLSREIAQYFYAHIIDGDSCSTLNAPLYTAFSYLAQTLTDLRMKLPWLTRFSLARLLSCCRNLTVLHCSAYKITGSFEEYPLTYTTSLVSVWLEAAIDPVNAAVLVPLFQCSPYLRHVSLNSTTDDILPAIGYYCPMIQAIESSSMVWDENIEDSCEKIVADIIANRSGKGIQFVMAGKVRSIEPLHTQLENSQGSLKYIHLQPVDDVDGVLSNWIPFLSNVLYGLKYLNLDLGKGSTTFRNHIAAILRNCPNLEALVLDNWCENEWQLDATPAPATHKIFDAIADLHKLKRLSMSLFDMRSQQFVQLLQGYVEQDDLALLEDLSIDMCPGLTVSTLCQIGSIISLKSLSVHFGDAFRFNRSTVTEFLRLVKQLPKLVYLELGEIELTFVDAHSLSESKTLREVMIMEVDIPTEAVELLEQRFSKFLML